MTRAILAKLGYRIVEPEQFEDVARATGRDRPDLRIADERSLGEIDENGGPAVPIIVLSGRHGVTGADSRIVGAVRRPAGLHDIFRLAQQVLEDTPRSTPRVPTHLSARCARDGREWRATLLSLSENGCLLRCPEPQMLGTSVELRFELPGAGPLELRAEVAYQLLPDLGMVFNATDPAVRTAIARYVGEALAAL